MATVATQIVPQLVTVTATSTAIARGVRVSLASTGLVAAAAIGVRGDYITTQAIEASSRGLAAPINSGGSIPVLTAASSGVLAIGDTVYSAASGLVSTTSTAAVIMGKAKQASTNSTLAVIELAPIL